MNLFARLFNFFCTTKAHKIQQKSKKKVLRNHLCVTKPIKLFSFKSRDSTSGIFLSYCSYLSFTATISLLLPFIFQNKHQQLNNIQFLFLFVIVYFCHFTIFYYNAHFFFAYPPSNFSHLPLFM